jgi:streptogramin lyase
MRRWLNRGLLTVAVAGAFGVAGARAEAAQAGPFGSITEFSTAPGSRPLAIVAGPDGALWFTEIGANKIGRMTTDGVLTDEWTVPTPGSQPDGIAIGPDGSVWFAEVIGNKIGRLRPDRTIVEYPITTTPDSRPTEVTIGPDGNVWFTERGGAVTPAPGSKVGKVDPSTGTITEYPVRAGSRPLGIVAGPDGNLWFTEQAGNYVGRISPAGVLLDEFLLPQANSQPWEPTVGPDGAIWFTEFNANRIGRLTVGGVLSEYAIPTAGSNPNVIVAGPYPKPDSLWFAETTGNKIGRITTAGAITEFLVPSPGTQPVGVAAGPDGHMWFAESATTAGNRIGRLVATVRVPVDGGVGGTVPATLSLSLGGPVSFGAFTPGLAKDYDAQLSADVVSTAGSATLSVADPAGSGRLVNGAFSLPTPLQVKASSPLGTGGAFAPLGAVLTYDTPASHDPVTVTFRQTIGATDALRTGSYSKTLTFTLSTTTP